MLVITLGTKPSVLVRSDNYIGALGAAVLANALKGNTTLTGLHIKGNELGNEGVKALCDAFRAREGRVTALDFGNNRRASQTASSCFHLGLSVLVKRALRRSFLLMWDRSIYMCYRALDTDVEDTPKEFAT